MDNIFLQDKKHDSFSWGALGDIRRGRADLGEEIPVLVYRLMQFTMLDALSKAHGRDAANGYFRQAGFLAGTEIARNMLDLSVPFNTFVAQLQKTLRTLKIGILRMEAYDCVTGAIELTVGQDLDCSGLPITGETVCCYDEGFLAGVLEAYTGSQYDVREVECWARGDRMCRFIGVVVR